MYWEKMTNAVLPQEDVVVVNTAIAIDRDKNSHNAVKWAIDHLHLNGELTLIHVLTHHHLLPHEAVPREGRTPTNEELHHFFLPFVGFCARKGIRAKEVILHDIDIASSLSDYINENCITTIVLGASHRGAIARAFKHLDVPTSLTRTVTDFCTVYTVSKVKALMVKQATRHLSHWNITKSWQTSSISSFDKSEISLSSDKSYEEHPGRSLDRGRCQMTLTNKYCGSSSIHPQVSTNNLSLILRNERSSSHHHSISTDFSGSERSSSHSHSNSTDLSGPPSLNSSDVSFEQLDYSPTSKKLRLLSTSHVTGDTVEDELRNLQQELEQTMDMYNSVCKEALMASEKAREINQWKSGEARKIEETKQVQEAALGIVMTEQQKCRAALEAARTAERLAELEIQKRRLAEMKLRHEAEEKQQAMKALSRCDIRYRRYTIEEIEVATKQFSPSAKIGEGGYGPVYKGHLDHTPVAIKVLNSDVAQGQKQFQREIEVLSQMRHPNMVLLLGACPEYGCLVYEHMERGSLEDCLFCRNGSPPLTWQTRFRIAAEIATALLFLHQTKPEPLVHRDLKPGNILLYRNYVSKIGDVGLSRLVPPTVADGVTQYHMTAAAGTFCYIDPEYQQTGMLRTKSDVYSLGVMLLQIITGRPPMGLTNHVENAIERETFSQILDPHVTDWPVDEALTFAKLAVKCCELRRKDRPDLGSAVLPELERLRDLSADIDEIGPMLGHTSPHEESYADSLFSDPVSFLPSLNTLCEIIHFRGHFRGGPR